MVDRHTAVVHAKGDSARARVRGHSKTNGKREGERDRASRAHGRTRSSKNKPVRFNSFEVATGCAWAVRVHSPAATAPEPQPGVSALGGDPIHSRNVPGILHHERVRLSCVADFGDAVHAGAKCVVCIRRLSCPAELAAENKYKDMK